MATDVIDTAKGFVNTVMSRVEDDVIHDIVFKSYTTIVSDYRVTIGLMITLLVVWIGFKFVYGDMAFTVGEAVRKLVVAIIIWGLLTNWDIFALFFYDIFTKGPNELAASLTRSLTGKTVDSYAGIADLFDDAYAVSAYLFGQVGLTEGWGYIPIAILYSLIALMTVGLALAFILIAKLGLGVVLIIAPIPIALLMFPATQGVFVGWLRALIGLALMPVMIVAALVFMLSIIGNDIHNAATGVVEIQMEFLYANMLIMGVAAFLFWHIMDIAKSIGGGLNISARDINVFVKRVSTLGIRR